MSNRSSRSKKPDLTSVTRKWSTSLYTPTTGEMHNQSHDFLNGYIKLATKLKRTHGSVNTTHQYQWHIFRHPRIKISYFNWGFNNLLLKLKHPTNKPTLTLRSKGGKVSSISHHGAFALQDKTWCLTDFDKSDFPFLFSRFGPWWHVITSLP
jgi:hypothetical protein